MSDPALVPLKPPEAKELGVFGPAEYTNREWRYTVETPRMCIVVAFTSESELRIVTAWRTKR